MFRRGALTRRILPYGPALHVDEFSEPLRVRVGALAGGRVPYAKPAREVSSSS
jgi:hypothetical protein